MARPLRIQQAGLTYHVMARGNARMTIFTDDQDRVRFLDLLSDVLEMCRIDCHAYCLMSTHYHALLRTAEANLSKAVRQLNGTYAQWWNHRHQRVGHVFQGRFASQVVQDEVYFLDACRYIVLNPVRGGLVADAGDWRWSSYRATAGLAPAPAFLQTGRLLSYFAQTAVDAGERYRCFVRGERDSSGKRTWSPVMGDSTFAQRFEDVGRQASREVPRRERNAVKPTLQRLFEAHAGRGDRNARIRVAYRHGYSLREIGDHLDLHYATISRLVRSE